MDFKSILVVGTIRDVESTIRKEIGRVKNALGDFQQIDFFLVESDSTDKTRVTLSEFSRIDPHFQYVSLGDLRNSIPERINRIRVCRNEYVKFIRQFPVNNWDCIAVVDLDGINTSIRRENVRTSFCADLDWDGCFANQTFGYYDLLALRATGWVEEDILLIYENSKQKHKEANSLKRNTLENILFYDRLREISIFNQMKKISRKHAWIEVQSAFGGFAFYRPKIFHEHNYVYKQFEPGVYSEHLDLNLEATKHGAHFYINPSLINSRVNRHNINRIKFVRIIREIRKL